MSDALSYNVVMSNNRRFGSLRRKFSRRGSLPADTVSYLDLPAVLENNNVGSHEDLCDIQLGTSAPAGSSNRLSRMFCMYLYVPVAESSVMVPFHTLLWFYKGVGECSMFSA